jgi:hypothetical protein
LIWWHDTGDSFAAIRNLFVFDSPLKLPEGTKIIIPSSKKISKEDFTPEKFLKSKPPKPLTITE